MNFQNGMDEEDVDALIMWHQLHNECPAVGDVVTIGQHCPSDYLCIVEALVAHSMGYN